MQEKETFFTSHILSIIDSRKLYSLKVDILEIRYFMDVHFTQTVSLDRES